MNIIRKNTFFKIALLLTLSLKVSVFVYESYTSTEFSIEKISHSDIEDSESEEKEIDELKKIVEYFPNTRVSSAYGMKSSHKCLLNRYNSRHLEYTTPPPEFS